MNKGKKTGKLIMSAGILLIASSMALLLYNSYTENRAAEISEKVVAQLDITATEAFDELPDYVINPEMALPVKEIDGKNYVGTLSVTALGLDLPVIEEWSYDNFKTAPCVYEGTPYKNNFIVAAHNYRKHFGSLSRLKQGDSVFFKDMDGNIFRYEVMYTEILDNNAVEEMSSGEWDMTLFTCTYGGATRITVRCKAVK